LKPDARTLLHDPMILNIW